MLGRRQTSAMPVAGPCCVIGTFKLVPSQAGWVCPSFLPGMFGRDLRGRRHGAPVSRQPQRRRQGGQAPGGCGAPYEPRNRPAAGDVQLLQGARGRQLPVRKRESDAGPR
jgi:hypothetical protein